MSAELTLRKQSAVEYRTRNNECRRIRGMEEFKMPVIVISGNTLVF